MKYFEYLLRVVLLPGDAATRQCKGVATIAAQYWSFAHELISIFYYASFAE
jgi:hypothetical protein